VIITEELLMAYADGELEGAEHAATRTRIEAAMRADPEIVRRIDKHRAMRRQLSATFDTVLDEPVPDRLIAALRRGAVRTEGGSSAPTAADAMGARASREGGAREGADNGKRRETTAASGDPLGGTPSAALRPGASHGAETAESSTPHVAPVSDISATRAAKAESAARARQARAGWGWPQWGAMAASLVIGAVIGHVALKSPELSSIASRNGHLVAQGGLADALSTQLASAQPTNAPVQIGTSFKNKDGAFCRTFVLHEGDPVGGLACRAGDAWNVHTLARAETTPGGDGGYRPAGSEMPAAVRDAVEAQIAGDPLDAGAEAQAKSSGWK
jgi:anti-sigma factor RsiW